MDVGGPVRLDHGTAWEPLAGVVEEDDAVAEQAPPLFGVGDHGVRGLAVGVVRTRADRGVAASRGEFVHASSVPRDLPQNGPSDRSDTRCRPYGGPPTQGWCRSDCIEWRISAAD